MWVHPATAEHAVQLLDRMWDADLGVPRRVRAAQDEGGTARQLRSFVDTFVTEDFLPDSYVDFRHEPACSHCDVALHRRRMTHAVVAERRSKPHCR